MGVVIRQSLITSVISYLGVVIGYFNLLWLYPKALDADQIGLFRILQDIALLLVPFAQLGIGQSLVKYFPFFNKQEEGKRLLLTFALSASIIGYGLFLVVYFVFQQQLLSIFSSNSPEVIHYFHIPLFLLFVLVIQNILENYARSLLKIVTINFIKDILIRLLSGLAVLGYFFQLYDFGALLNCLIIIYSLSLLVFIGYLMAIGEFRFTLRLGMLDRPLLKKYLLYGIITVVAGAGSLIVLKVDSIMVTSMLGLAENGIYTTVFYIAVIIEIPRRVMAQIAHPLIANAFENQRLGEIHTIYQKSAINMLIIGMLFYIGIMANLENIFDIMPNGDTFRVGKIVVIAIGLGKLVDMASGLNGEIIVMSDHYKYNVLFVVLLAILNVVANFIFIPIYGLAGAAIASAFSLVCFNISKYIFIYRNYGMQPFSHNTIKALLVGGGVYLLSMQLPQMETIVDIIVRSTAITIVFCWLIFVLEVSDDINKTVRLYWQKWKP